MKLITCLFLFCFGWLLLPAQSIDTEHILLEIQFNWKKKQATGRATIRLHPLQTTREIVLDAGFLTIHRIQQTNTPLQYQYNGGDSAKNLHIQLNRWYQPGENITIQIDYTTRHENRSDPYSPGGSFGKGLRFMQPTAVTPAKRKQLWSSGEPESNKYWFPCNEDIADIHTTEIMATVEKPLMVIASGYLFSIKQNANHTRTFHYRSSVAYPNYLVSIVAGEYSSIDQRCGKTLIKTFGYPHEKEAVKATVERIPDMIKFLETKTGVSYPFANYSQVVVQDYPFPGLVGQHGASILSDNYIDDYGVHKDYKYLWDGIAMQALANQWFGNLLMPKRWEDIWLNNAFAQYFAGMYTTQCFGKAEYLLWYHPFEKSNVMADRNNGNIHPVVPEKINDITAFTSDSYSRFKGALVLRMLQMEMGDTLWWKAIQFFVQHHAYRQVSTKDFQDAVEKVSNKSYQWFFDQWMYKTGMPVLEVSTKYNAANYQLTLTIQQVQKPVAELPYKQAGFFRGKIMVEINGKTETITLLPKATNIFTFSYAQSPAFVHFNTGQVFLCEVTHTKSTAEYIAQLQQSIDYSARQEALNQLVNIANDTTTLAATKETIINAFIGEANSNHYWRYRSAVLSGIARITTAPYTPQITGMLQTIIQKNQGWLRSAAINLLGNTRDSVYLGIYQKALRDESDRVINAAAIAIGKTKSSHAFDILMQLEHQASWKNQNRISALNGLQQLDDVRAVPYALHCIKDNRSPRWYLAVPQWDYPFAAVNTLVSLGKASLAYPVLYERLRQSLHENDLNDIFQHVQMINLLKLPQAKEIYVILKQKYCNETPILEAVNYYETQFSASIQ